METLERTCNGCGWVAFGVSRDYAQHSVEQFNQYFDGLSKQDQQDFYGGHKSSIKQYEMCIRCGGSYKNFREFQKGDCPQGVTLNPIIVED